MQRKIKNKIFLVLGILALVLLAVSLAIVFYNFSSKEERKIYTSVVVSDRAGFDLNSTALTFGAVSSGQSASRALNISNNRGRSVEISIRVGGAISDFLVVSENNFVLGPGETKRVGFSVYVPKDAEPKKYDGEISIISRGIWWR